MRNMLLNVTVINVFDQKSIENNKNLFDSVKFFKIIYLHKLFNNLYMYVQPKDNHSLSNNIPKCII